MNRAVGIAGLEVDAADVWLDKDAIACKSSYNTVGGFCHRLDIPFTRMAAGNWQVLESVLAASLIYGLHMYLSCWKKQAGYSQTNNTSRRDYRC